MGGGRIRIGDLHVENREGWRRITARVVSERPEYEARSLWFEVPVRFGADLAEGLDPFLVAALPLAVAQGETALSVEGPVCSSLRYGAAAAAEALCGRPPWGPAPGIEAERFDPTVPRAPETAAAFLTGGVDSLAMLRANVLEYPRDHPDAIRTCYVVYGLLLYELEQGDPRPERVAAFEAQLERLGGVADAAGVELVPIRTNVRALFEDYSDWVELGFGAGVVGTALALPGRADRVWVASDGIGLTGWPYSTHPLLLPLFSTAAVTVKVGQPSVRRLEKTRLVVDWKPACDVLEVCTKWNPLPPDVLNCGDCEKCLRTAVSLIAIGRLDEVHALPRDDLSPEELDAIPITGWLEAEFYREYLEPLERVGRPDLARVLRRKLRRCRWRYWFHRGCQGVRRALVDSWRPDRDAPGRRTTPIRRGGSATRF